MAWSYTSYVEADSLISVGLFIFISAGVLRIYYLKKGKDFVIQRIVGIEPHTVIDADDDVNKHKNNEKDNVRRIGLFFAVLAAITLSFTAINFFQGCFLANARLFPNDECPEYPMDCFVSNKTHIIRFRCDPSRQATFPNNTSHQIAWCYGWIINLQATKNIVDQLGVCTGLIGLFTSLLAIIVYLGKSRMTLVISIILIACGFVAIVISLEYEWSHSPLTFNILLLGMTLGIFGIFLYCTLPTIEEKNDDQSLTPNTNQTPAPDTNQTQAHSNSNILLQKSPSSTATLPSRITILCKSSKVAHQTEGEGEIALETI